MKRKRVDQKKLFSFLLLALLIATIIVIFSFVSPEELVSRLGVSNGYILAFFVSLFGGFSAGGSVTFIALLIALVSGGLDPFYLAVVSGVSLVIGDAVMFYVGSKGRELVTGKWDKKIRKVAKVFKKNEWLEKFVPIFTYIYIGFTPLPNDLLILFLAAIRYPSSKMYKVIILGDLTFTLLVTMLAAQGLRIS